MCAMHDRSWPSIPDPHAARQSQHSRTCEKCLIYVCSDPLQGSRISFNYNNRKITRRHDENMLNKRICQLNHSGLWQSTHFQAWCVAPYFCLGISPGVLPVDWATKSRLFTKSRICVSVCICMILSRPPSGVWRWGGGVLSLVAAESQHRAGPTRVRVGSQT